MGKGSSPPPAPDYSAAAREQGDVDKEALAQQTYANRPDQITPWGTTQWSTRPITDPVTGQSYTGWQQTQAVSDPLQQALSGQIDLARRRTGLAGERWADAAGGVDDPLDYSQFRSVTEMGDPSSYRQAGEDAAYRRSTSRLDPQFEEDEQALQIRLRNQGLRPGDEAYEAEMNRLNRRKTDAYQAAMDEATAAGRAESALSFDQNLAQQTQSAALRNMEIDEALGRRYRPLEEINMLLAGQGVQPPSSPGFSTAGRSATPNLVGAATQQYGAAADAYNAQQARNQSLWSGLAQLGSGAIGMWSDVRLKRDIERVGSTLGGVPLYRFRYRWGGPLHIGVMAHDVPHAAHTDPATGYQWVDYSRVR